MSRHNFALPPPSAVLDHLAVTGSLLMIIGFTGFCFTLVLYATGVRYGTPRVLPGPPTVTSADATRSTAFGQSGSLSAGRPTGDLAVWSPGPQRGR